jgi:hypothetical protein
VAAPAHQRTEHLRRLGAQQVLELQRFGHREMMIKSGLRTR